MRTQDTTGLSADIYDKFSSAITGGRFRAVAHRFSPLYTTIAYDTASEDDNHDAIAIGDYIVQVLPNSSTVRQWDGLVWTSHSYTPPTGANKSVSLAVDGSTLYLFQGGSGGIYRCSSTDYGETFGAWTQIVAASNPIISAAAHDEVHYYTPASGNLRRLYAASGPSWTPVASHIYLTRKPHSFSAVRGADRTIIVVSTGVPGRTTARFINNAVSKIIVRSEGLLSFTWRNGQWSNHAEVDIVDDAKDWRSRRGARISYINGTFYLLAQASDGPDKNQYIQSYRMYTTKDGIYWSRGAIQRSLGVDHIDRSGKLVLLGDYIYTVKRTRLFRSLSTLMFGHSPASAQIDLSDRILGYSATISETRQSKLVIDNSDGVLDGTFLNPTSAAFVAIAVVYQWGYDLGRDGDQYIQVSVEEVDTVSDPGSPTQQVYEITSRDRMAWLTDQSQAEQPKYWESQLIGGDQFVDTTTSKYGGLRHTETVTGDWKTSPGNNYLYLATSDKEGIAFSTFDTDLWNGHAQVSFTLSKLANNEFAGIVFRAVDKDNMLYARYDQTSDTIQVYERRKGEDTLLGESSAKGWSGSLAQRHLRVEFNYAQIAVLSSSDGVSWDADINTFITGVTDVESEEQSISTLPFEKGHVGFIAKGYSDEDQPPEDEDIIDDEDDDIDYDDWPDPDDETEEDEDDDDDTQVDASKVNWIHVSDADDVYLVLKVGTVDEEERDITPPMSTGWRPVQAIWNPIYSSRKGAYVLAVHDDDEKSKVYYTSNAFASDVEWSEGSEVIGIYDVLRAFGANGHVQISCNRIPVDLDSAQYVTWDFEGGQQGWDVLSEGSVNPPDVTGSGPNGTFSASQFFENRAGARIQVQYSFSATTTVYEFRARTATNGWALGSTSYITCTLYDSDWNPLAYGNFYTAYSLYRGWSDYNSHFVLFNGVNGIENVSHVVVAWGGNTYDNSQNLYGVRLKVSESPSAGVRSSINFGASFGPARSIGGETESGKTVSGDLPRIGSASMYGNNGAIYKATTEAGLFTIHGSALAAFPASILVPWYRIGSSTQTNYNSPTPDYLIGLSAASGGYTLFKVINSTRVGVTLPGGTQPVFYSPNGICTWKGYRWAVLAKVSGDPHVFTTSDTGQTWTDEGTVDATSNYIRLQRLRYGGNRVFVANGAAIKYTTNFGTSWSDYTSPTGTILSVEPYG